ncbi:MAG: radical SAM protein [Clostridia bacterium]|nr:radical SAM protein [Clostridia bacterium]
MKIISEANKMVLKILGQQKLSESKYRLIKYCVQQRADNGFLLFNVLTRELLLLSDEEFEKLTEIDYLKDRWFLVPESFDDKKCADTVRWVQESTQKKSEHITSYTILTTTDCNARCFYCFEKGQPRIHMSEETALKTAEYIKKHCGGEKVGLTWFGGEPLYNLPIIDLISDKLKNDGVEFTSFMISNGYLFNDKVVKKASENWNLRNVQITLDGTEEVYNKSKAYIYREGSPYQVVLGNVERLLESKIAVNLRLNMDLYNAENLMKLADELAKRFGGRRGVSVYVRHIFASDIPMAEMHTEEEWEKRHQAMCQLEDRLSEVKLLQRSRIKKRSKLNSCMADSGNNVVIVPTGNIGLCEHYINSEFVGNINREGFDISAVDRWKERAPEIPECADCFFYPECIRLKKCTVSHSCYSQRIKMFRRKTEQSMLYEYELWCDNANFEATTEDEDIC